MTDRTRARAPLSSGTPDEIVAQIAARQHGVTMLDRIPVTRVARMLVDLAEVLTAHQLAW